MKLALDLSHLGKDGAGIGYVIEGLLEGFKHFPKQDLIYMVRSDFKHPLVPKEQLRVIPLERKFPGKGFIWYSKLASYLKKEGIDYLISPTLNSASLFFPNTVQFVHDISPLTTTFYTPKETRKFRLMLALAARKAKWLVTISKSSMREIEERFPNTKGRVKVVPLGLNTWSFAKPTSEELDRVKEKYELPKRYFFSISTLQPRKNYLNMVRAFALYQKEYPEFQYLIAGKQGWYYDKIYQVVKELDLQDKVKFLGYVDEEDIAPLMDLSSGMLFASFQEGFGLPVIEACARGVPIIVSDIPVFREVAREGCALFVDPEDPLSIKEEMENVFQLQPHIPDEEFFSNYDWKNTVAELLKIIESKPPEAQES